MTILHTYCFITFCGILGIFLRKNLLNILVSFLQTLLGINGLFGYASSEAKHFFPIYLIIFLFFVFIIFMSSIAILLIKRRSTLYVDELTELRG